MRTSEITAVCLTRKHSGATSAAATGYALLFIKFLIAEPIAIPSRAIGTSFHHEPAEYLRHKRVKKRAFLN